MDRAVPISRDRSGILAWVGQCCLLAALYFGTAWLGLQLAHYHDAVTLIWPPTGLSLAALMLLGLRLWPGVFVGALMLYWIHPDLSWTSAAGVAFGNALEAVIGAWMLTRVVDFEPGLSRPKDVASFLLIGVLGSTLVGATVGVVTLLFTASVSTADFWPLWFVWWLGDMGGALILAPPILMIVHGIPTWRSLIERSEFWIAMAALAFTCALIFVHPPIGVPGITMLLPGFPVLVWAGTRLGSRGATLAAFVLNASAALAIATGFGPLAQGPSDGSTILLWSYAMIVGLTAFTLAAVVSQRDAADRRHRAEEAEHLRTEKEKLLLLERQRLMREMHDGLGGQLVTVLSLVERGRGSPDVIAKALRSSLDEIRIVIDSLDAETKDLRTTLGKLRARLIPLLKRNEIDLDWYVEPMDGLDWFSAESSLNVLRIVQESVTNAMRHSGASKISVRVTSCEDREGWLHVSVSDDGSGLPAHAVTTGRGLHNVETRSRDLGGQLRIQDAGPGTRVDLRVPVPPQPIAGVPAG